MNNLSLWNNLEFEEVTQVIKGPLFQVQASPSNGVVVTNASLDCPNGGQSQSFSEIALATLQPVELAELFHGVDSQGYYWQQIGYYDLMRSDYEFLMLPNHTSYDFTVKKIYSLLAVSDDHLVYEFVAITNDLMQYLKDVLADKLYATLVGLERNVSVFLFIRHNFDSGKKELMSVLDNASEVEVALFKETLGLDIEVMRLKDFQCQEKDAFLSDLSPHFKMEPNYKRVLMSYGEGVNAEGRKHFYIDLMNADEHRADVEMKVPAVFDENDVLLSAEDRTHRKNSDFGTHFAIALLLAVFLFGLMS